MGKFQKYSSFLKISKYTQQYSTNLQMYSTFSKYTQVLFDYSKYTQVLSDYSKYTQVLLQYSKNILKFYYTIPKYYTQVSQGLFKPIPQFESGIKVYNRYCCCRAIEYILIRH